MRRTHRRRPPAAACRAALPPASGQRRLPGRRVRAFAWQTAFRPVRQARPAPTSRRQARCARRRDRSTPAARRRRSSTAPGSPAARRRQPRSACPPRRLAHERASPGPPAGAAPPGSGLTPTAPDVCGGTPGVNTTAAEDWPRARRPSNSARTFGWVVAYRRFTTV